MSERARAATGTVMTVLGPVAARDLGITLPHEHLSNDLSSCLTQPAHRFTAHLVDEHVSASSQWALRQDPYCCRDNVAPKPVPEVTQEARAFADIGGRTIVDATGSRSIGRDPQALVEIAQRSGLHVVMSTGPYLERFEREAISARSVDRIRDGILADLQVGVSVDVVEEPIRAGMIGEIGISCDFTPAEHASLRAGAAAQRESGAAMNIHMPGWQRRGHEVLDIAVDEMGADPARISLAHSDPSGADTVYQRELLARGVMLEFDMIGLDITFPGEGISPAVHETADAVTGLIADGHADQILLSHDLFLKQMWTRHGGNGFLLVPTAFLAMLGERGVPQNVAEQLVTTNPQRILAVADGK